MHIYTIATVKQGFVILRNIWLQPFTTVAELHCILLNDWIDVIICIISSLLASCKKHKANRTTESVYNEQDSEQDHNDNSVKSSNLMVVYQFDESQA